MRKFFTKIFDKDIFIILILGGLVFGLIKYVDYRFNLIENQIEIANKESLSIKNDFQNKIKTDFVLNQVDLLSRFEQIKVAVKQQSLAQKELDLAQARFERGLAGNQEVVDAQTNVAEAEDGLVDSLYQYYVSELEWARNMGDVRMVLDT